MLHYTIRCPLVNFFFQDLTNRPTMVSYTVMKERLLYTLYLLRLAIFAISRVPHVIFNAIIRRDTTCSGGHLLIFKLKRKVPPGERKENHPCWYRKAGLAYLVHQKVQTTIYRGYTLVRELVKLLGFWLLHLFSIASIMACAWLLYKLVTS